MSFQDDKNEYMAKIKQISAREILNSKGNPTVEAIVILSDGTTSTASCPSGTSVGSYEAVELKDMDEKRYQGLGVLKAVENVERTIAPKLLGLEAIDQQKIDSIMIELDGTQNKGKLGANAILPVSMAICKAAAKSSVIPLFMYIRQFIKKEGLLLRIPTPAFNVLNGGLHADAGVDIQEFLIIPATSKPYSEALQNGVEIYKSLKKVLSQNNLVTLLGEEGGFGPKLPTNKDAFFLLKHAVESSTLRLGFDVFFGVDIASNTFYKDGTYHLKDRGAPYSSSELAAFYSELDHAYPFLYLEDPFQEDDWNGWEGFAHTSAHKSLVIGDDLVSTNPYRLQMAINKKVIDGVIIKPNQIGTIMETLAVVEVARSAGLKIVVSHRSGETNEDFIADFAVAISADYVKFGAPARGERIAKFNRLLQIENQLKTIHIS